jgi:hypothetical protein
MVHVATTTYIVSSNDRTGVEISLSADELRAANNGDGSIRRRIIQEYDDRSTYRQTDDLFSALGIAPDTSWSDLTFTPVLPPRDVADVALEARSASGEPFSGGAGCSCPCSTCEENTFHCHNAQRGCR